MPDATSNARIIYDGARFQVREVELSKRSGGIRRREVVAPADAVVILPLLDPEHVVMIRNERFAVGSTLWELPAGTIDPGESPEVCAARELREETGYAPGKLTRLIDFYPTPGYSTEMMTAYRAEGLRFEGQDLDETERITVEELSLSETMQMVRDSTIRDAKTIAILLYHWTYTRH